jgi:DNA polymerase III subunit delta'
MAFSRTEAIRLLGKALAEGRLGHAYLISGASGSGVSALADEFAGLYLGTGLLSVQGHPDFHAIEPGSKSRRLLTDQIRGLEEALHKKPERGFRKVAVIRDADRLMTQAANAFLKTLEEPPEGSLLLLTTELPEALLETIRSRCIGVVLHATEPSPAGPGESRLADALDRFFSPGTRCDATAAFAFTRIFRDLLQEAREESEERIKEELAAEKSRFGKTTEGDWDFREETLKAAAEAEVLQRRSQLLGLVSGHFGSVLRGLHERDGSPDPGESRRLLRCIDCVERIRSSMERGVQEALAMEAGFLELMTASCSESPR